MAPTSPLQVDRAGDGDVRAAREVALRQLVDQRERERQPGRRATDAAGVDVELERQLDAGRVERDEADDGAAGIPGRVDQLDLDRLRWVVAALDLELDAVAGFVVPEGVDEVVDRAELLTLGLEQAVARVEDVVGRRPRRAARAVVFEAEDLFDDDLAGHQLDVLEADRLQGHELRDLLRGAHHLQRHRALLRRRRGAVLLLVSQRLDLRARDRRSSATAPTAAARRW